MITRIHFEDKGQDFLYWDVYAKTGKVLDSQPFQGWIWTKVIIVNVDELKPGSIVKYYDPESKECFILKYRIETIETFWLANQTGSIDDIKITLKMNNYPVSHLKAALEDEKRKQNRSTVIKMIEREISNMRKEEKA